MIDQVVLFITGAWMAFALTRPNFRFWGRWYNTRPWAYIIGLVGQTAWLYTTIVHAQWGALALSVWWTWCYLNGLYTHFFSRRIHY